MTPLHNRRPFWPGRGCIWLRPSVRTGGTIVYACTERQAPHCKLGISARRGRESSRKEPGAVPRTALLARVGYELRHGRPPLHATAQGCQILQLHLAPPPVAAVVALHVVHAAAVPQSRLCAGTAHASAPRSAAGQVN